MQVAAMTSLVCPLRMWYTTSVAQCQGVCQTISTPTSPGASQRAQRQQQPSSMSLEQSLAMFQDKPSHHSNDIHLAAAPTCARRDFSTVRQQPFPDRLYHQQHYRLNQDRGHLQSHLPHAIPMPLSVTQELGPQGLMAAGHMLRSAGSHCSLASHKLNTHSWK